MDEVKRMIPLAASERILLDFESAAINAYKTAFTKATVVDCYLHLTKSVI